MSRIFRLFWCVSGSRVLFVLVVGIYVSARLLISLLSSVAGYVRCFYLLLKAHQIE